LNALTGSFFLLGTVAFVLVSLVIGVRLVRLALRTGEKPELYLGLGILGTAVFGYGAQIGSVILRGGLAGTLEPTPMAVALTFFGKLLHDAGLTLVLVFVLKVFRRNEAGARMLLGIAVSTLWIGMIGLGFTGGYRDIMQQNVFWWMEYGVVWTYPLWGAYESFRYHRRMRRRARIGLADPLVANRFLLWGLASMGTFTATWLASWTSLLPDPQMALPFQTFNFLSTAAVGICTVTLYSLAFLPPAWYRRWVAQPAIPNGETQAA
jgi:hypothetical protein